MINCLDDEFKVCKVFLFKFAGDLKSLTGDFNSLLTSFKDILGGDAKSFLEIYFKRLGLRSDYDNLLFC